MTASADGFPEGSSEDPVGGEPPHYRFTLNGADDRPVLVVLHQENSTPGRVGQVLTAHGLKLDMRRPVLGDRLPEHLDDHRGVVVFGGPPSANDEDEYIRREIDWLGVPLAEDKPLLGICLGAQMLARTLGARVFEHPEGLAEVGYYPLRPTRAGLDFLPDWPSMIYQWHREGFDLPGGATLLAEGETYRNQAFRYGKAAFGVQFHTELTLAMLHRWTTKGHERLSLPGAQPRGDHFHGRLVHDPPVRHWMVRFLARVFGEPRRE